MDRNVINNIAEYYDKVSDVKDAMISNNVETLSVEVPLAFELTLDELDKCDSDETLERVILDKNWKESISDADVRVEAKEK